jgi:predicted aconitase with swiveling domain
MHHSESQVPSANEQLLWLMMIDTEAAKVELELLNGCNLRGKPMIIEYARGSKSPSLPLVAKQGEKALIRLRKQKSLGKHIIP